MLLAILTGTILELKFADPILIPGKKRRETYRKNSSTREAGIPWTIENRCVNQASCFRLLQMSKQTKQTKQWKEGKVFPSAINQKAVVSPDRKVFRSIVLLIKAELKLNNKMKLSCQISLGDECIKSQLPISTLLFLFFSILFLSFSLIARACKRAFLSSSEKVSPSVRRASLALSISDLILRWCLPLPFNY